MFVDPMYRTRQHAFRARLEDSDLTTTKARHPGCTVRRQTTTSPGGLVDKGTQGTRARLVPLIPGVRPLLERRLALAAARPDGRLFVGPRRGRVSTAILRDATTGTTSSHRWASTGSAATTRATPA
jgi:integrase